MQINRNIRRSHAKVRLHIPEKISVPADIMNSATETDAGQNTVP